MVGKRKGLIPYHQFLYLSLAIIKKATPLPVEIFLWITRGRYVVGNFLCIVCGRASDNNKTLCQLPIGMKKQVDCNFLLASGLALPGGR